MKVLWLCNMVLNDFAEVYGIKKKPFGGWMDGLLRALEPDDDMDIVLCFPIFDENRMKTGIHNGHRFFSFHGDFDKCEYDNGLELEFECILKEYNPDIIHIWGTEYNHSRAMVEISNKLGIADKVIVHIQGLVSYYALHYCNGVPEKYLDMKSESNLSIREQQNDFFLRGDNERRALQNVHNVMGRTKWDYICTKLINPQLKYYHCDEMLRMEFYCNINTWSYDKCKPHRIFISQGSYSIKGLHFFLQAMKIIEIQYPDVEVHIGGGSPVLPNKSGDISGYGQFIIDLIKKLERPQSIKFLGLLTVDEMIREYKEANVFLSPSLIENSSNSIQEASLIGAPIVSSNVGGCSQFLGPNDVLYSVDEWYIMAGEICSLFAKKDRVIEYEKVKFIDKRKQIIKKIKDIYESIS